MKITIPLTLTLPMNLPLVAADVRRRIFVVCHPFRLLTSAATVQGFNARIHRGNLSQEGNSWFAPGRLFPSWEGSGVGSFR